MKQLCYFLLLLIAFNELVICNRLLENSREERRKKSADELLNEFLGATPKKKEKKLPKGPLLWEGWIKFIRYTNSNSPNKPANFFTNKEFNLQKVPKKSLTKKDDIGYINIKDKFQFFAVFKIDALNIFGGRRNTLTNAIESIRIADILKIDLNNKYKSSVLDLGNFAEGACMKIHTKQPQSPTLDYNEDSSPGNTQDWILCFEKPNIRDKLVSDFIELKINQQKKEQEIKLNNPPKTLADMKNKINSAQPFERPNNWMPKDGYWVLLQDWTQCTLKCGGGKSYQHWMCIPPKQGGKPCQGKAIRSKPCNNQPCPGTKTLLGGSVETSDLKEVAKPIIKSLPFSSRPQNYIKCQIKENDVFYLMKDPENSDSNGSVKSKMIQRPSRIVMNAKTVSIYDDDSYKNAVFSFDLKKTEFAPVKADKCCFTLQSGREEFTICGGFGQRCGSESDPAFLNEWSKDFNLFKFGCYEPLKEKNWKAEMAKKAMKDAMDEAGLSNLEDRANLINKKIHEKKLDDWSKKIQNTQNLALTAIKRELNIEKMIQQELQLKAELEAKYLLELKKRELKKKDCLDKALKDRETQDERIRENKQAQLQIEKIKEDARKEVEKQRDKLRKKIDEIKRKANRRKRLIEQDINVIRGQMAKNLMDANRNGDMLKCKNAFGNKEKINDYCNANLVDHYEKNLECKEENSFCYVCCETEFGNMVLKKRDECYAMCDNMLKNNIKGGDFIWS